MSASKGLDPNRRLAIWLLIHAASFGIVLSIYLFAAAAHDQQRGIASIASPAGPIGYRVAASRVENPELFVKIMGFEWIRASLVLAGAMFIRGIGRSADRTDPFSRRFAGKEALDECERTLDSEWEKNHRPLR